MPSVNIGVLISGNGTNLQTLVDNTLNGSIHGRISIVVSSKKKAYGLTRAKTSGINTQCIDAGEWKDNVEYNRELLRIMQENNVELVVLAGFLKILSREFAEAFENRIINIHPSLIPSFCGEGYYGEKVHQAVLEYGVKLTGATVHFVDAGTDTGPIIMQEAIEVDSNDTIESLKNKVLEIEHRLLPRAVRLYCEDRLEVRGRRVIVRQGTVDRGRGTEKDQ